MPRYDFQCPQGHEFERMVVPVRTSIPCHCGANATRKSVYSFASPRKWASEFQVPAAVRDALSEAHGYRLEAVAAKEEAVTNGWRG